MRRLDSREKARLKVSGPSKTSERRQRGGNGEVGGKSLNLPATSGKGLTTQGVIQCRVAVDLRCRNWNLGIESPEWKNASCGGHEILIEKGDTTSLKRGGGKGA